MKYVSVQEKAKQWQVSERQVQYYCRQKKITGAYKQSGVWMLPKDAPQPKKSSGLRTLNVLSLFSGCGGLDLGFEGGFEIFDVQYNPRVNGNWNVSATRENRLRLPKTRFSTVFANDIRPDAQICWSNYFTDKKKLYCLDSIVDLVKLHRDNNIKVFPDNVDVVTGGFPCQDFSVAGKRLGLNSNKSHNGISLDVDEPTSENRGKLYIWMREVISLVKPNIFVAENVKGLVNLGDVKQIIESDFASIADGGYHVFPARVLKAADYGISQSRERVIFIGLKKSALRPNVLATVETLDRHPVYDPYPSVTHSDTPVPGLLPYVKLQDILGDLDEPDASDDIDQQKYSGAKFMGKHCQGQTEVALDHIAPTIRSEHHGNIEFRRLSLENGGKHTDELNSGLKERRLTIRECARIQSFPDDYQFVIPGKNGVSTTNAYKLIGNAVPPLLGFHIAMRLEELWPIYFDD